MNKSESAVEHITCSAKSMSAEQIENWRETLVEVIGPYALLMSDTEVQKMRDTLQARVDEMPNEKGED